jgi:hypothetical protein
LDARHGGDLAVQPGRTARAVGSLRLKFENLPIGIQLIAKWLDEVTILRLGAMLERSVQTVPIWMRTMLYRASNSFCSIVLDILLVPRRIFQSQIILFSRNL